jgi:hypothetical protein
MLWHLVRVQSRSGYDAVLVPTVSRSFGCRGLVTEQSSILKIRLDYLVEKRLVSLVSKSNSCIPRRSEARAEFLAQSESYALVVLE